MQSITDKYGSFTPVSNDGFRIDFQGLSADFSKLPTDNEKLLTGSTAFALDTGEIKIYHADTKTWYDN